MIRVWSGASGVAECISAKGISARGISDKGKLRELSLVFV